MKLSDRRRKVLDGYMAGKSKTNAMLDAGYSESMARTRANDIFTDPAFESELKRRQSLASHRSDVTLDWIVGKLKDIAGANIGDLYDTYSDGSVILNMKKMTPELMTAMTGLTVDQYQEGRGSKSTQVKKVRVILADKLRALELLVRHLGLSKEKQSIEVTGELSLVERLHRGRSQAGNQVGSSEEGTESER